MLLSVIICTYNRASLLAAALEGVCQQTLATDEYEIIVVDNNSTDDTPTVCRTFAQRYAHLRSVVEPQQGLSPARNRGWQEALGDYVAYIDDDCIVPAEWLSVAREIIHKIHPDVFGGPYFAAYLTPKPAWFSDRYGSWQPAAQATFIRPEVLHGGNLFLRRVLLEPTGGFRQELGMQGEKVGYGEETDLLLRLQAHYTQTSFYYDPHLFVHHVVRPEKLSIRWHIQARFIQGKAASHVWGLRSRYQQGRWGTLLWIPILTLYLAWGISINTLLRDRTRYPNYRNYWYEVLLPRLSSLGSAIEHYRCLREHQRHNQ